MKKRILAFISVIMSLLMGICCLPGCNLVTTDIDKDMAQVVATVEIDTKDEIYKKDLIVDYMNTGYLYVQYYGYTMEQTFDVLMSNRINGRLLVQTAMKELNADSAYTKNESISDKNNPQRYLDEDRVIDAKYNTYQALNSILDTYSETHEHNENADTIIGEVRTTPTGAANETAEKTKQEKQEYINDGFDISSSQDRRDGYDKVVKLFDENGLLGSEFTKTGNLEDTEYFKNSLKGNLENQLLDAYEDWVTKDAKNSVTFEELENAYLSKYEEQKSWNNADFVESFKNASLTSPVLYSGFGKYGYVYNLLLGANDEQTKEIEKIRTDAPNISDADYSIARAEILKDITVKDLRSSWVLSGYDAVMTEENKFIFQNDYTFAKDSQNSLPFQGDVSLVKEAEGEHKAVYSVASVNTFKLDEFIEFMDGYLNNDGNATITDNESAYSTISSDVYKASKTDSVTEYSEKINEMLFAFSTDSGSLNTFLGYTIKPAVDSGETEEYVETFGTAGRILLEQGTGYVIVASDFGYHVMFFSELIDVDYSYDNLTDYLNKITGEQKTRDEWKTYYEEMLVDLDEFEKTESYLFNLANSLITTNVNAVKDKKERDIINKYRYEEEGHVVIYKDRYSDLFNN